MVVVIIFWNGDGWKQYTNNIPICNIRSPQIKKSDMEYSSHMSNKNYHLKTNVHNEKEMPKTQTTLNMKEDI